MILIRFGWIVVHINFIGYFAQLHMSHHASIFIPFRLFCYGNFALNPIWKGCVKLLKSNGLSQSMPITSYRHESFLTLWICLVVCVFNCNVTDCQTTTAPNPRKAAQKQLYVARGNIEKIIRKLFKLQTVTQANTHTI